MSRTAGAGRGTLGRPAQRVAVADFVDAIAAALQQEGGAHFLHQVGGVVRRRAVDAEADATPASSIAQTGQVPEPASGCCRGNA